MSLDHILLGLLRQPASGYDLKAIFDQRIGYFWAAELSQIYPTLQRMEKKGWLKSRPATAKRGPKRKVYQITAPGRRALRAWLEAGPELGNERFTYLAKVYLMDELGDLRKTLHYFSRMRDQFAHKLEALRQIERYWAESDPRFPDDLPLDQFHVHFTLRKGLLSLAAHVEWCDECTRRIRAHLEKENGHVGTVSRTALDTHRGGHRRSDRVLDSGGGA